MAHPKTGGYLPVPNVQELAQTWNGSGELVPDRYVRTEEAAAEEVVAGCALPVVDLGRLLDARSSEEELANLGSACQHWGYFQLINHGVPEEVIQDVRRDIAEFFRLPLEAKKAYAQLPEDIQGYGQGFVFSETQKLDWADMIYLKLRPIESRNMRFWPAQPPTFRNSVGRFSTEVAKVTSCLLRLMAVDMGVEPECLLEKFGGQPQTMKVTYYPPCRQAGDVLGLSPHTDVCALTLLLHVNHVQGLQIRRDDGKWHAVEPLEGAFMMLSNGKYKSVEHKVAVHPDKERISAAMFHQLPPNTTVGPLPELVKGSGGGARYRSVEYADFMKLFFASRHDEGVSHLDHYRI
ncbi:S-norcoclaurine synthase 1 [Dichanthelium oligosanthes]|uniref:S-norcoclaurine synthase 1 n=1 Tax=Dichanthelium oligosanthes TaxID=888268 RepID=A0A1E5UQ68_9POAL|nr:S-norcoclaurine synthase 1 [Dichanthelium oligosanthes]